MLVSVLGAPRDVDPELHGSGAAPRCSPRKLGRYTCVYECLYIYIYIDICIMIIILIMCMCVYIYIYIHIYSFMYTYIYYYILLI